MKKEASAPTVWGRSRRKTSKGATTEFYMLLRNRTAQEVNRSLLGGHRLREDPGEFFADQSDDPVRIQFTGQKPGKPFVKYVERLIREPKR